MKPYDNPFWGFEQQYQEEQEKKNRKIAPSCDRYLNAVYSMFEFYESFFAMYPAQFIFSSDTLPYFHRILCMYSKHHIFYCIVSSTKLKTCLKPDAHIWQLEHDCSNCCTHIVAIYFM